MLNNGWDESSYSTVILQNIKKLIIVQLLVCKIIQFKVLESVLPADLKHCTYNTKADQINV